MNKNPSPSANLKKIIEGANAMQRETVRKAKDKETMEKVVSPEHGHDLAGRLYSEGRVKDSVIVQEQSATIRSQAKRIEVLEEALNQITGDYVCPACNAQDVADKALSTPSPH